MSHPTRHQAIDMFLNKYYHNFDMYHHGFLVALTAQKVAEKCGLDKDKAFVLGLLHDWGYNDKRPWQTDFHPRVGYNEMAKLGYGDVARICLTHSFPNKDLSTNNFNEEWLSWAQDLLKDIKYDDYDKLIQLSDMLLVTGKGVCGYIERINDINSRYHLIQDKLDAMRKNASELKAYFDAKCGCDIYGLLEINQ